MPGFDMFRNQSNVYIFAAGETIFHQGDPRDFMFVVKKGEVEIRLGHRVLEVVGPGGIFGEMAMINGHERTATTVALTDCAVVAVDQKRFQFMVQQTPCFAIEVMRVLADRLRRANQLIDA